MYHTNGKKKTFINDKLQVFLNLLSTFAKKTFSLDPCALIAAFS